MREAMGLRIRRSAGTLHFLLRLLLVAITIVAIGGEFAVLAAAAASAGVAARRRERRRSSIREDDSAQSRLQLRRLARLRGAASGGSGELAIE